MPGTCTAVCCTYTVPYYSSVTRYIIITQLGKAMQKVPVIGVAKSAQKVRKLAGASAAKKMVNYTQHGIKKLHKLHPKKNYIRFKGTVSRDFLYSVFSPKKLLMVPLEMS